ncbi:hypothetical protein J4526_02565 [Desulfurococcaceae archaeon MEX13E-LK6-19]|nr:hypothetical protein J4526_02565 [Desulfurococcaceae archaeon MEX13E-LK6-19]
MMKKLSPSDPSIRYRVILDIVLKENVIASKIIAKLKKKDIKNIELIGRSLRITLSGTNIGKLRELLDKVLEVLKDEDYDELCYQLYLILPYEQYIEKLMTIPAESTSKSDGIEIKVFGYDNEKYWMYINSKKKKLLLKKLSKKITSPILDPGLISEVLFITCINSIDKLIESIQNDISKYESMLKNLT